MGVHHHRGFIIFPRRKEVVGETLYAIENADSGEIVHSGDPGHRRPLRTVSQAEHYIDDVLT